MNNNYIPELPNGNPRLGRHIEHDPRSIAYRVTKRSETWPIVRHALAAPVLDQGSLGACTGFATVACMSHYTDLADDLPEVDAPVEVWNRVGQTIYSQATALDPFPGEWPVDDTGSTGLAAAKAAQRGGYLSGYQHILEPAALAAALREGPVIVGTYWYESMFYPLGDGLVTVDFESDIAGGHEYVLDEVTDRYFGFRNSWGTSFGVDGRFYIDRDDFLRLLADNGDATKLIPVTEPAPVPVPPPVEPTPEPAPESTTSFWEWLADLWRRVWAAVWG